MTRKSDPSRVEQEIEKNLKRAFEDVASEELPSRFTDLLASLKTGKPLPDKGAGETSAPEYNDE